MAVAVIVIVLQDGYSKFGVTDSTKSYVAAAVGASMLLYEVILYAIAVVHDVSAEWRRMQTVLLRCCFNRYINVVFGAVVVLVVVNSVLASVSPATKELYVFANLVLVVAALEGSAIPVFTASSSSSARLVFPSRLLPCPVFLIDVVRVRGGAEPPEVSNVRAHTRVHTHPHTPTHTHTHTLTRVHPPYSSGRPACICPCLRCGAHLGLEGMQW